MIQDFIKRECGQGKVDEYVFATTLQKLISMQEKEVEFSVVDKGEYKLRTSFEHIRVTSSRWSKMTENQMQAVLKKIHTMSVQDVSLGSHLLSVNQVLSETTCPLLKKLLNSGVDWIPRDLLAHMTKKASGLKINRLDAFLKWLVTTKRKTGGINYSKAITFGMPSGRGRKPNQPPRKRSKVKHPSTDDLIIIPRITHDHHVNSSAPQSSQLQSESRSNQHPDFQPTPRQELNMFSDQLHPNGSHGLVQASGPGQPCSRSVEYVPPFTTPTPFTHLSEASYGPRFTAQHRPPYPSPYPNSFIVYFLGFCPVQTSVCFGCGSSLKPGGQIGNPPADLVIVSNMHRE